MWIIPNNYQPSSASALDMVESKEDLNSQALNIESSLMWRSKPSPLRTWSQRWSRVTWFQHLSGRILKPSQHTSFETQLTSSLEDIRASRLAWQEGRKPLTIPDTSSPTSSTMCEQLDLLSASSRMSKDTSIEDLNQSSKTWKAQVTIQRGEYSQRKKLAHLTNASASSYWPTPTLHGNYNRKGASQNSGDGLETAVKKELWPTPRASGAMTDSTESVEKRLQKVGYEAKLEQAVRKWPTPSTRDHKGGYKGGRIRNGKVSMDTLDVAVQHTNNKDQRSGTLNPTWVEWLMGLPTEWTDLDSWVTELSPKQPPEHGRS